MHERPDLELEQDFGQFPPLSGARKGFTSGQEQTYRKAKEVNALHRHSAERGADQRVRGKRQPEKKATGGQSLHCKLCTTSETMNWWEDNCRCRQRYSITLGQLLQDRRRKRKRCSAGQCWVLVCRNLPSVQNLTARKCSRV